MKNIKTQRTLALRTHTIRDLTAEDLRLAVGGRSGSAGSGSGHSAGSGSDRTGGFASKSYHSQSAGSYGSYGSGSGAPSA